MPVTRQQALDYHFGGRPGKTTAFWGDSPSCRARRLADERRRRRCASLRIDEDVERLALAAAALGRRWRASTSCRPRPRRAGRPRSECRARLEGPGKYNRGGCRVGASRSSCKGETMTPGRLAPSRVCSKPRRGSRGTSIDSVISKIQDILISPRVRSRSAPRSTAPARKALARRFSRRSAIRGTRCRRIRIWGSCSCSHPLRRCRRSTHCSSGVDRVLDALTVDDARAVYAAIRNWRHPGGLGHSATEQDVADEPTLPLLRRNGARRRRDDVARQYANGYADVFDVVLPALASALQQGRPLETAIVPPRI